MAKIDYYEMSKIPTVDARKVLATIDEDGLHHCRKRRLDELSSEEKVLRRKVRNRVASKTARDRKKTEVDNVEEYRIRVEQENKILKQNNEELRTKVHQLRELHLQLKSRLGLTPTSSPEQGRSITHPVEENYRIITPSVADHDQIAMKQRDELGFNQKEETQTVFLIDDNESIKLGHAESKYACRYVDEMDQSNASSESLLKNSKLIYEGGYMKVEEFDGDLPSDSNSNEATSHARSDLGPLRNSSIDGVENRNLCTEPEVSLLEEKTLYDGHFSNNSSDFTSKFCNTRHTRDPLSDLFPSLISV